MRLIRSKFQKWLKAKAPEAVVGENRECHSCPIALYYVEASGGCEIVIGTGVNGDYTIDRGDGDRALPWWAHRFVFLVDGITDRKITACAALEVLAKC
jgi:hypothetical protein